jgi:hypothetical protein
MSEYEYDYSKLTLDDYRLLMSAVAVDNSNRAIYILLELAKKSGADLENMGIHKVEEVLSAFMKGMIEYMDAYIKVAKMLGFLDEIRKRVDDER